MMSMCITLVIALANLLSPACVLLILVTIVRFGIHGHSLDAEWTIYCAVETAFYLLFLYRHKRLLESDPPLHAPSASQRAGLWADAMRAVDREGKEGLELWIRGWFIRAPKAIGWQDWIQRTAGNIGLVQGGADADLVKMTDIKRGNIEEWLAATFFSLPLLDLLVRPAEHHALLSLVFALEHRRNHRFPSGYNPDIRAIRPALDEIPIAHRPLLFYIVVATFNYVIDTLLWCLGFRRYSADSGRALAYQYHPGLRSTGAGVFGWLVNRWRGKGGHEKTPIVFLHGLGGYAPLIPLIGFLLFLDRPIFIVEQPHVSFKLAFRSCVTPSMTEMVSSVHQMLADHESTRALVIAHSLGSALAAALTNHSAHDPKFQTILIDPISILLYHPHLVRTFSVCRPRSGMAQLLRYFSLEMGVAQYISRRFNAFEGCLLLKPSLEKLTTKVILARNDCLIPVSAIQRHCEDSNVDCEILEDIDHGGFLLSFPIFQRVWKSIREVSDNMRDTPQAISMGMVKSKSRTRAKVEAALLSPVLNDPIASTRPNLVRRDARTRSRNNTLTSFTIQTAVSEAIDILSESMSMSRSRSRSTCGSTSMLPVKSIRIGEGTSTALSKTISARSRAMSVNGSGMTRQISVLA